MNRTSPFSADAANLSFRLPDGRRLGYCDAGDRDGVPVLYFHGFPGSRLEATLLPAPGLRLIGVDRPGYGLSSPKAWRRLADWPADIVALADHLKLDRFGIIGVSGGAPYASAVAHGLKRRVNALALVCGLGPPQAPGMDTGRLRTFANLARRPLRRLFLAALGRRLLMSDRALARLRARRAPQTAADADFLATPKRSESGHGGPMGQMLVANWREGLRRTSLGMAADARIYGEDWHFGVEEIVPPTHIWHGRADTIVPVSIGEYYAARIPGAGATFTEADGHYSIVLNSLGAITDFLRARA